MTSSLFGPFFKGFETRFSGDSSVPRDERSSTDVIIILPLNQFVGK